MRRKEKIKKKSSLLAVVPMPMVWNRFANIHVKPKIATFYVFQTSEEAYDKKIKKLQDYNEAWNSDLFDTENVKILHSEESGLVFRINRDEREWRTWIKEGENQLSELVAFYKAY